MEQDNKTQESGEVAVKKNMTKEEMERWYRELAQGRDADLNERIAYFENEPVYDAHWAIPSMGKRDFIGIGIVIGICIICAFVGVFLMIPWLYG